MSRNPQSEANADDLERALAQERSTLAQLANEKQRSRRAQAIEQLTNYVAMLRDTAVTHSRSEHKRDPFSFKLEFDDGRWNVAEKELPNVPCVGDIVSFDDGPSWRIRTSQLVPVRPARKAPRTFFVCAPA